MSDKTERLEFTSELPEGSMPTRAIEIVMFFDKDGRESCVVRVQSEGNGSIVAELGMLEYAKGVIHGDESCTCEEQELS